VSEPSDRRNSSADHRTRRQTTTFPNSHPDERQDPEPRAAPRR
jgi:hypothetical protein